MASVRRYVLVLCLLAGLAVFASPTYLPAQNLQTTATPDSSHPLLQYTLPPDKLEKAYALYLLKALSTSSPRRGASSCSTSCCGRGLASGYVTWQPPYLDSEWCRRRCDVGVRAGTRIGPTSIRQLRAPRQPKYGLSVQQWGSWFGDWGKTPLLGCLFASVLGWILYAVLRGSPRRWWFYFWLAIIPIVVFVIFIQPIWIDPLFNKFEPLTGHHAD